MAGKIITIANFKGGVGKTLISYLLYKHFEEDYFLIQSDLDSINKEVLHINNFEDFKNEKNAKLIKEALNNKNVLIDTGGFQNDLQDYFFKKSNLIIIPLFLDNTNIKRTFVFLKYLKTLNFEKDTKFLIVINKYNKNLETDKNEFIEYVKNTYNINNFFVINDYKSFQKSLDNNLNLIEEHKKKKILYKQPVKQIIELQNKVKELL